MVLQHEDAVGRGQRAFQYRLPGTGLKKVRAGQHHQHRPVRMYPPELFGGLTGFDRMQGDQDFTR